MVLSHFLDVAFKVVDFISFTSDYSIFVFNLFFQDVVIAFEGIILTH